VPVSTRLEELLAASLSLLDNVATVLLTFPLVCVIGRVVVRPLVSAALGARDTERTLEEGLEREGIDLGTAQGPLAPSAGAGPSPTARGGQG